MMMILYHDGYPKKKSVKGAIHWFLMSKYGKGTDDKIMSKLLGIYKHLKTWTW